MDIGYHPVKGYFHKGEPDRFRIHYRDYDTNRDEDGRLGWENNLYDTRPERDFAAFYLKYGQLRISLKTGLGQLSELKNLRFLNVENLGNRMAMEDAEWMEQYWKRLDYIEGHMCSPFPWQAIVCRMLQWGCTTRKGQILKLTRQHKESVICGERLLKPTTGVFWSRQTDLGTTPRGTRASIAVSLEKRKN
jgi:hypothetical protein